MAFHYSPKIVTDGLEFYIDAANPKSYTSGSTTEYDLVGSQDMILNNGVSYSTDNLGTLEFDGLDDYTQTANNYNRVETMSWDVWFNRTQSNNFYNMVWANYLPYLSFLNANVLRFSFITILSGVNTQRVLDGTTTLSNNTWYNVCCTLETNTTTNVAEAKMYINGELEGSLNLPGTVDEVYNVPFSLRLSRWSTVDPYPFEGKIPSLKVYNKILSTDEVRQNFNATKTRFGL